MTTAVAEVEIHDEYTVQGAARYLGLKISKKPWTAGHLYNLINRGEAPRYEKRRNRVIFKRTDLDAYVKDNTEVRRAYT